MTTQPANRSSLRVRILARLFWPTFHFLSGWFRKNSYDAWRTAVGKGEGGGTYPLGQIVSAAPGAFARKQPESLVQQGFPVDLSSHNLRRASLPAWAKEIEPFLANQLSSHTRRAYETDLRQFFSFLEGRILPSDLSRLRPEHIILYRKHLEEGRLGGKPLEKTTINRKLAVVKSFLNWLRVNQLLVDNPAQLVKGFPQNQESALKGLSDAEADAMLRLPETAKRAGALHSAILHVLLYLGLRKGELIDLKIGDLGEERGVPVMKVRGKGHRVRILPITSKVRESLDHYLHACRRDRTDMEAPLFIPTKNPRTKETHKRLNPNAITYIVLRYARKAGILKKISPHSCRATCISNALDKRATHRSVQSLAGWSTPLMIQRYDKRREDLQNSAAFVVSYEATA